MSSFLSNYITPTEDGTHRWMSLNASDVLASRGQIIMYARTDQTPASSNHFKSELGTDLQWVDKNGLSTNLANTSNPSNVKNWFLGFPNQGIPQVISIVAPNDIVVVNPAIAGHNFRLFSTVGNDIKYNGDSGYLFSIICQGFFKLSVGAGTIMDVLFDIMVNGSTLTYIKVSSKDDGTMFEPFCLTSSTVLNKNDIIELRASCNGIVNIALEGLNVQINQISP